MSEIGAQSRTGRCRLSFPALLRLLSGLAPALLVAALSGSAAAQEVENAGAPAATQPATEAAHQPQELATDPQIANCPVPPQDGWSKGERHVWKQICLGKWADLSVDFKDPFPGTDTVDQWLPERTLSAAFLLRIMTDPVYVAATPFAGIRIDGAHFREDVVLSDVTYDKPLVIVDSVFTGVLVMERFRSKSRVKLTGDFFRYKLPPKADPATEFNISFDASSAEIAKGVDLNWITSNGEVDLSDTNIGPLLEMSNAEFRGKLWMNRAKINGTLFLQKAQIQDDLLLDGADVAQNLEISDLKLSRPTEDNKTWYGALSAPQLHVGGNLVIGYSDKVIRMPQRLVGQSEPPAESIAPPSAEPGSGAAMPDPALTPTASLPAVDPAAPVSTNDLAGGSQAQADQGTAAAAAQPERTFNTYAWRINLTGARIDGELRIRGTWVLDQVTLEDAVIGDDVWLSETDLSRGSFSSTSIKGFVLLQGTHVATSMQFDSTSVGRSVVMDDDTEITGLRMPGAAVKGGIYFAGAKITGFVDLDSLAVDRDLAMGDGSSFTGAIDAGSARIGGSLDLTGGSFVSADLTSVTVDRDLIIGHGATFSGPISARFARIGGSLDLTGGRFASVDLTGAEIAAELRLAAAGAVPEFARAAELNLRNATTYSLQDVAESWPCVLHLEGFTYQRQIRSVSKPRAPSTPDPCDQDAAAQSATTQSGGAQPATATAVQNQPVDPGSVAEDRAAELATWLARQEPFSPQPYVQLANVLRQSGDNETAKAILFAGKERELRAAGWWSTFLLSLQFAFTGFGLYPYVSGIWVVALIAAGTVIFGLDPSPEMRRFTVFQRLVYSLDMLIPAVHLRHHHTEIELQSWPRFYLYGHKLMGYVLLSFLAAALLGLGGLE